MLNRSSDYILYFSKDELLQVTSMCHVPSGEKKKMAFTNILYIGTVINFATQRRLCGNKDQCVFSLPHNLFKRERSAHVNTYHAYNATRTSSSSFCSAWFDREYTKALPTTATALSILSVDGRTSLCWFSPAARAEEMSSKPRRNAVEFMAKVFDGLNTL